MPIYGQFVHPALPPTFPVLEALTSHSLKVLYEGGGKETHVPYLSHFRKKNETDICNVPSPIRRLYCGDS
jgi:hypothetical protein